LYRIIPGRRHFFYTRLFRLIGIYGRRASSGAGGGEVWTEGSYAVLKALENVGVRFEITGLDNIRKAEGPVVFIGNHMSALETFVLPCIIQPIKPMTFGVKSDLVHNPVNRHRYATETPS
jgi:1-acyl-sn-glycerol-3-phosphate acyltransferase